MKIYLSSFLSIGLISIQALGAPTTQTTREVLNAFGMTANAGVLAKNPTCIAEYSLNEQTGILDIKIKTGVKRDETISVGPTLDLSRNGYVLSTKTALTPTTWLSMTYMPYADFFKGVSAGNFDSAIGCHNDLGAMLSGEFGYSGLHGFEVVLMSRGGRFDFDAEDAFYKFVGSKVASRTIEQLLVVGSGDEGGHKYCLEINMNILGERLRKEQISLQDELMAAIKPNAGTEFKMKLVQTCKPK